ncbi:MAG: trypsin-like peptidase domain-containing protein [Candidatus Staskawiczbacteria bacterium]|nr:trypsin-like peptidase domain-containing protein [Candidatus Staskawiczbacteria bacterium]
MNLYNLPKFDLNKIIKNRIFLGIFYLIVALCLFGYSASIIAWQYFPAQTQEFINYFTRPILEDVAEIENLEVQKIYTSAFAYEQAIIDVAKNVSPSVVSIVISKNVPVYEQQFVDPMGDNGNPFGDLFPDFNLQIPQQVQKGTQLQEIGAGSGFIVSEDGLILTNKHVVSDRSAEYAVFTNDGQKYNAKVLALDPVQDLAIIKIQLPNVKEFIPFPSVILGDSSGIQIGQTAIAIGNALGQFSNTVSVGVVSGLGRTISASDNIGSFSETLEGIIQTDTAINSGNSGGPLVNLKGEVIGINTAMAEGAQSIGFALPINMAKKDIDQVVKNNKIVYPFLGVRYILVDEQVKEKYKLSIDYGALVLEGDKGEPAVTANSAAEKAGIKEKDVILEINGEKITKNNSMAKIIQKYNPGDKITLHILRNDKAAPAGREIDVDVTLGERSS